MRALGLLCGVGSLLREARDAGFEIVGNLETRAPFRTAPWVWEANFPGVEIAYTPDGCWRDDWYETELAIGHPPCGSHSSMGQVHSLDLPAAERKMRMERRSKRVGLLPLFVEKVNELRPQIFALDNLPKILGTVAPESWWRAQLPKYRLTFLTILNYDYGTPQRRQRLWVIGVRKPGRVFEFVPTRVRQPGPERSFDAFRDLPWEPWRDVPELGHVHFEPNVMPTGGYPTTHLTPRQVKQLSELSYGFLAVPPGTHWAYRTKTGRIARKPGRTRLDQTRISRVLTGLATLHHPWTGWPLTPRERARLMDWPDDFHLADGEHALDRSTLMRLTLFTGKAVPSRFPRYLLPQLIHHLRRKM